jgi:hypothetical protein
MDEIMVANFMVFHDLVSDEPCDLWIADEFWDVDHFLFDNRELKRTAYAWLTDARTWRNPQMTQTGWRLLRLSRCAVTVARAPPSAASVSCTVISRVRVGDANAPDEATRADNPVAATSSGSSNMTYTSARRRPQNCIWKDVFSWVVTVPLLLSGSFRSGDCVPAIVMPAGSRSAPPVHSATGQDCPRELDAPLERVRMFP